MMMKPRKRFLMLALVMVLSGVSLSGAGLIASVQASAEGSAPSNGVLAPSDATPETRVFSVDNVRLAPPIMRYRGSRPQSAEDPDAGAFEGRLDPPRGAEVYILY